MLKKILILILGISILSFSETTVKPRSITESLKTQKRVEEVKKSKIQSTEKPKSITKSIKPKKVEVSAQKKLPTKKNITKANKIKEENNSKIAQIKVDKEEISEEEKPDYTAVLIGDMEGNIIYGENENEIHPLASTTKVMTMILAFEAIEKGEASLNDYVKISKGAAAMGGSKIQLKAGQKIRLEDLMKATAIHSANNAAYAVGEHIGHSYDNFIKMMNQKAVSIGIDEEVEFYTPTGLPPKMTHKGMDVGSPKGMYKLMLEANKHPEYLVLSGTKNEKINNGTIAIKNKNALIGQEGIYGLKTGFHNTAGFNILVMGEKDEIKLNYIVFGGRTAKIRDEKVLELDREIREKIEKKEIVSEYNSLWDVPVSNGNTKKVKIYPQNSYERIVKKSDDIVVEMKMDKKLKAPLESGDVVGKYIVYINKKVDRQGNVIVKEAVLENKSFF